MKPGLLLLRILLPALPLAALAAPPSRESVAELVDLSQAQRIHAAVAQQQETAVKAQLEQMFKAPSPEMQPFVDDARAKILNAMRKAYEWEGLRENYITIYQENFTQAEVDGLLAFYRSPAGKALNEKTAAVTQRMVAVMSQKMSATMGEVIQSFQEQRRTSQEKAMHNNAKMLRAAADQYFLENGVSSVATSKIIGPGTYIKRLLNVAGETYPETIERGKPIVIRRADGSVLQFE